MAQDSSRPVPLIQCFNSDRDEILYAIRENLRYVRENGGSSYTFEALAERVNSEIGLSSDKSFTWDKSFMRRFMYVDKGQKNYVAGLSLTPKALADFAALSVRMREEVQPHIEEAARVLSGIQNAPAPE